MKTNINWAEQQPPSVDTVKSRKESLPQIVLKEPPKKGFCGRIWEYFAEYSSNSSIHGVRYIGEVGRTFVERVWWVVVFAAMIVFSVQLILKTYQKWQQSPVIVSFAQSPTPVWQIPFPAVTVCSETKTLRSIYNFTDYYHKVITQRGENITEEEEKEFGDMSLLCDNHLYHGGPETTDKETIKKFEEAAPTFSESFWECKWTNTNQSCSELFSKMLTEDGVCYTFNMLDTGEFFTDEVSETARYTSHGYASDGWTLETGYPPNTEVNTYPRRAVGSGFQAGMVILMRAYEKDLEYICRGPVQGFKILLHHPAEVPRVSQQYFRAPLDQEVVVAVKPDMMTTSDGLRDYDPHRRNCYFPSERQLRFYQTYTQRNCEVECLTNFTYQTCGCVAYHMPHDENTPICGSGKSLCMGLAQRSLLEREITTGITDENAKFRSTRQDCDCLPACTSLTFNAETSQADFNWPKLFTSYGVNFSEFPGIRLARVNIFFKENQFITSRRSELYGPVDFLANCGGLLGLFMGFSILSFVEIAYFLTLRMWCNIKMHGRKMWSSSVPQTPSAPYPE